MKVIYETVSHFDDLMSSGIYREKYSKIQIKGRYVASLITVLNKHFTTNLDAEGKTFSTFSSLDILIWNTDGNPDSLEITLNERFSIEENKTIVLRILDILNSTENVEYVIITKYCEINSCLVEEFLASLKDGDVFENILDNISKLSLIDSGIYQENKNISSMIDEYEQILFAEIVNNKIRVNGKVGVLKEVNGVWGRYGFFETGTKKNYINLSLVQKNGGKVIRSLEFR